MYNTSQNYKDKILNDSTQHELNIYIDGNKIEENHIIDFKITLELFNNDEFCLGSTPELDVELEIDKRDLPNNYNEVYIESGLEDEIVPIGKFTIQSVEDDEFKVKIKATDYMKKFEDNKYDGSDLTYPATILQVLQDICTKIGVELGSTSFLNSDKQISVYDNTVSARTYLSYIAEQAEGFAVIGRDGKLYIKTFELQKGEKIAEGKNINFTSSIAEKIILEKLEGSSTQVIRSGKNLFNGTLKKGLFLASNGVTFVQNNNYVCFEKFISVTGGETYSVSNKNGITGIYYVLEYDNDKNFIKASNNSTTAASFTTMISSNCCYIRCEIGNSVNPPTVESVKDFQIEKGPATEYEPYKVSSSPDYPSKIKNVADNINIFDGKLSQGYDSNGTIRSSNQFVCNTNLIDVKSNTQYVVSNNLNSAIVSISYYKNGTFVSFQANIGLFTITMPADVNQIRINFYKESGLSVSDFTYIKFEEGSTATQYSPYGEGSINIKTHSGNYFDLSKYIGIPCALNGTATVTDTEITIKASSSNVTYTTIGLGNTGSVIAEAYRQYCMEIPEGANKLIVNFKNNNTVRLASIYYNILDENYTVLSGIPRIYNSTDEEGILQADINVNNAKYVLVRFDATTGGDVTYKNISLGKTDNYVPYGEQDKVITLAKPLYQDCYLAEDGIHYTRKQIVLDGSEDEAWSLFATNTSNQNRFTSKIIENEVKRPSNADEIANIICSHFIKESANDTYRRSDGIAIHPNGSIYLYYDAFKEYTIDQFKTWLSNNPITVEYELESEEIVPYTTEQQEAWEKIKNLKLFEGVNNIASEGKITLYSAAKIELRLFKNYKWGEKFKVSKVFYEDGVQNYKFGDETASTIYINQNNMYIVDSEQVKRIYTQIKDFEVYSFEGETIIDPAYDIGDVLVIDGKNVLYQGELEYSGKFRTSIKSKIQAKTEQESMQTKKSNSNKIKRVQSQIDQVEGKITQLVEEIGDRTEKTTTITAEIDEISSKVSTIADLTDDIKGVQKVILEKCIDSEIVELHIYGNNVVFKYQYLNDSLCLNDNLLLGKDKSIIIITDEEENKTYNDLGIKEVLRQNGSVYDEYILKDGQAQIIRRINKDGSIKDNEEIEDLGEFHIPVSKGKNILEIKDFNANMYVRWAVQNQYTDVFATKAEMNSEIKQSSQEISLSVDKKLENYSTTTEMNTTITQTAEDISSEVRKKVGKDEIISKINQSAEQIQVEANKISLKRKRNQFNWR